MSKDIAITVPNFEACIAKFNDALEALGKNQDKALAGAVNKTLRIVRAEAAAIARAAYTARQSKLFDSISLKKATRARTTGVLTLTGGRGVSLIHFQARPNIPGKRPPEGVSAKVRRDGERKVYGEEWRKAGWSKPFIMKKAQGGHGVFVRYNDKFNMLFGASPIQALQREEDQNRLAESAEAAFPGFLEAEIDALFAKAVRS